jgi:hypothetical protein
LSFNRQNLRFPASTSRAINLERGSYQLDTYDAQRITYTTDDTRDDVLAPDYFISASDDLIIGDILDICFVDSMNPSLRTWSQIITVVVSEK